MSFVFFYIKYHKKFTSLRGVEELNVDFFFVLIERVFVLTKLTESIECRTCGYVDFVINLKVRNLLNKKIFSPITQHFY